MIEDKPLSKEGAGFLLRMMAGANIPAASAADLIAVTLSLQRIAAGTDMVSPVTIENEKQGE